MFNYYIPKELLAKKPHEQELTITLRNGSTISLIGADKPDNLRGVGLDGVVFDEFADVKRNVWPEIVRPMLAKSQGWAIFMGTPKGKQNHLYEAFIRDPERADKDYINIDGDPVQPDDDYKSYRFVSADNPHLPSEEIIKAKKELAPQYFAQEWEASFENYTGIIYKEYKEKHNIPSIKLRHYWSFYVGIDTGRHTAVTFMAVNEQKKCFVFDEIYDFDGIVRDIAARIKAKCTEYAINPVFVIDSASQVKNEYKANGVFAFDSVKEVEDGIAKVRSLFSSDSLYFVSETCKVHMVQHKGYVWDEKLVGVHRRPTPLKENDHTCDSLQYIVSTFVLPEIETPKQKEVKKSLHYLNVHKKDDTLQRYS